LISWPEIAVKDPARGGIGTVTLVKVGSTTRLGLLRQRLGHLTLAKIRNRLRRLWGYSVEERIYRISAHDALLMPDTDLLRKDCVEDLKLYRSSAPGVSEDAMRESFLKRRSAGEHCYTRVEDGVLVSYGWMIERQKRSSLSEVQQEYEFPPNTAVIYDLYTDPRYRQSGFYQACFAKTLRDAATIPGTEWIYVTVLTSNRVPLWWVERLGFSLVCSIHYERKLWTSKKWQS
jgi:hypothetical protein